MYIGYSIYNGLLYKTATDGGERLCIPDTSGYTKDGELTLREQFANHVHNNLMRYAQTKLHYICGFIL